MHVQVCNLRFIHVFSHVKLVVYMLKLLLHVKPLFRMWN